MKWFWLLFMMIGRVGFTQTTGENPKPITFILLRHAERGNDGSKNPPLTEEGMKRAARLAETLKNTNLTAIYSTDYQRTKNTVLPLSQLKNLQIKLYEAMKEGELKQIIDANRGGTVVICGHSNSTPWTANFLTGEKLDNFSDTDYDNILVVTFWNFGKATLVRLSY